MRAGQTDGQTAQGITIPYGPNESRVKMILLIQILLKFATMGPTANKPALSCMIGWGLSQNKDVVLPV